MGGKLRKQVTKQAFILVGNVLLFGITERPNLIDLNALTWQIDHVLRWYRSQTWPMFRSNLTTVFLAAPVMRTVECMELPSTSAPKTCTRFCIVSLFILTIMLDCSSKVKDKSLRIFSAQREVYYTQKLRREKFFIFGISLLLMTYSICLLAKVLYLIFCVVLPTLNIYPN